MNQTQDYKIGDRIEMVHMPDDPDPISAGTRGTVDRVTHFRAGLIGPAEETHLSVTWDSGRTLNVILPVDVIKKVSEHEGI